MTTKDEKFTEFHLNQYKNLSDDARFMGDQHFKIITAYLVINGFIGNIAVNHPRIILGLLGCMLSYLFLSWDKRTTQWWKIVFEKAKQLEHLASSDGKMIEAYLRYPQKSRSIFLRATQATELIYFFGFLVWILYSISSWPNFWK